VARWSLRGGGNRNTAAAGRRRPWYRVIDVLDQSVTDLPDRSAIALRAQPSGVRLTRQLVQVRSDFLYHPAGECVQKPIRRNDVLAAHAHAQLTKAAPYRLYVKFWIAPKRCRHPGGNRALDGSNRTVVNYDRLHGASVQRSRTLNL